MVERPAAFMSYRGGKPRGKCMFERLYRSQGGMCACCRKVFPRGKLTRDHVVPLCKGGSPQWDNIQLLCAACNVRKGNQEIRYVL